MRQTALFVHLAEWPDVLAELSAQRVAVHAERQGSHYPS